jgi:hypothetical protein
MNTPILFLIFNRPSTTKQIFDTIRNVKPSKLYIAADGPRKLRSDDQKKCEDVKEIVMSIDWEVKTLFRIENLGCKLAVSSAITWFFENEEEGIILEDDVLPLPSFFTYCVELLEKYRYEEKVAIITGSNLISKRFELDESYFFSHYANIWGWASWRRVWNNYDVTINEWPEWYRKGGLKPLSDGIPFFELYWKDQIDAISNGKIDTWDFQLFFTCWKLNAYCVVPRNNLTSNLGFGEIATHTTGEIPDCVIESTTEELIFPIIHPLVVERSKEADMLMNKRIFNIGLFTILKWKTRRIPILGKLLAKIKNSVRKYKF